MSSTLVFGSSKESTWLKDLKKYKLPTRIAEYTPYFGAQWKEFQKEGMLAHAYLASFVMGIFRFAQLVVASMMIPWSIFVCICFYIIMSIMRLAYYAATSAKISAEEDPDVLLGDVNVKESVKRSIFPWEWKGVGQGWREFDDSIVEPRFIKNLGNPGDFGFQADQFATSANPFTVATLPRTRLPTRPPGATRQHCLLSQNVHGPHRHRHRKLRAVRKRQPS